MMKPIPKTKHTLVLRTDFSDETAWDEICRIISTPVKIDDSLEFKAYVDYVSDLAFAGLALHDIMSLLPDQKDHFVLFVVDKVTIQTSHYPLLCVDLVEGRGNTMRVVASAVQGVENNLSVGNLGFDELAELVDEDGIFHGIDI